MFEIILAKNYHPFKNKELFVGFTMFILDNKME